MTALATKLIQPSLAALTAKYLAQSEAIGDLEQDVELHEVQSAFATDPKAAWTEAMAAAKLLGATETAPMPADWAAFVRQSAAVDYLPMCIGHFPQQVSDVSILLSETKAKKSHAEPRGWTNKTAKSNAMSALLEAAAARVLGRTADAEKLLRQAEQLADTDALKNLVKNELAALGWSTGDRNRAVALWTELSQTAVGAFNLGVSAMATTHKADARNWFQLAASRLPETSGWHHLAKLYLALAQA